MKIRKILSVCLLTLFLLPAGCQRQVEEDPFRDLPYGIQGLELGQDLAENDVTLLAVIQNDALARDGYFALQSIYDCGEDCILLNYSISNQQLQFFEGDPEEHDGKLEQTNYLVSYDLASDEVKNTLCLGMDENYYLTQEGDAVWVWDIEDDIQNGTAYDFHLNQIASVSMPLEYMPIFSPDCSKYYNCEESQLCCYSCGSKKEPRQIAFDHHLAVELISGIFTDDSGTLYALLYGRCGDLKNYQVIARLDTGRFCYVEPQYDSDKYFYTSGNALLCQQGESYTIFAGTKGFTYDYSGEDYLEVSVLPGGKLLFQKTEYSENDGGGSRLYLWLYNGKNGALLGSTTIQADDGYLWFSGSTALYPDEDALLLGFNSSEQCVRYYRWDYQKSKKTGSPIHVKLAEVPDQPLMEMIDTWDPRSFTPGDCPEELSELRGRADLLEKKWGIRIFLSKECRSIIDNYAVEDLSDYDTISDVLDILEYEAGKYPDGFFRQLKWDGIEGLDLYLAGQLIGVGSGALDYAGGFTTTGNNRVIAVLDCTSPWETGTTFHHEISHAIENKLQADYENLVLDESTWAQMNPDPSAYDDSYTYSYDQFGREELLAFTMEAGTPENAYFVDGYSMTFPTEDRARLFENVMWDDSWVDWEHAPHLQAKLNYYAQCIRNGFDTDGWGEVRWERYQ